MIAPRHEWTWSVAGAALGLPAVSFAGAADGLASVKFSMLAAMSGSGFAVGWWMLLAGVAGAALAAGVFAWWLRRAKQRTKDALFAALGRAECIIWEAEVFLEPDRFRWVFETRPSGLFRRLFGDRMTPPMGELWTMVEMVDQKEMDARSRAALLSNAPGYEQEFRVTRAGATFWLQERVSIQPVAKGRWHLVGVITDATAQRHAQEELRKKEAQVHEILANADCLVWRTTVVQNGERLDWVGFDLPDSTLYRRIIRQPLQNRQRLWSLVNVPELAEMNARSRLAILSGAPSYEQEFRVIRPEQTLWLREQVSITRVGPKEWNLVGVLVEITARREAEEARKATEVQLQQVLARADCLLWQAHVTLRPESGSDWVMFIPRSELYRRLFGDDPEQTPGLVWSRLNVGNVREMNARSESAIRHGFPSYEQEFHGERNGQIFWLHENVSVTPAGPNRWNLVGVVTDITARRSAEAALRASEERFRALFEHAPVAILEADFSALGQWFAELRAQGVADPEAFAAARPGGESEVAEKVRIVDVNAAALLMFRASDLRELAGRMGELARRDILRIALQALRQIRPGSHLLEAEMTIDDFAGGLRHTHVRCWVGKRGAALDLSHAIIAVVDLTELKEAEAALAAEKERLAVTLHAMADGVITTDTSGVVLFINPAAADLLQRPAHDAIGRPAGEICLLQDEGTHVALELPTKQVVQADEIVNFAPRTSIVGARGASALIEGCCAPIHDADAAVIGTVMVFRDVTERERLARELIRSSKLESVGVLAGGIAHDFNNILTVIVGNLNLARLGLPADGEMRQFLREAEAAALQARDLTRQLLTFAKGGDPVRAAVRLPEMIVEVANFALHGSRVKCEFDLPQDLWFADADKGQIAQVVQNLVINSVQAMPEGGTIKITAANEKLAADPGRLEPGDYVRISVRDSGIGIKPEHLARIFDPYFTTKQQGSGLGLATVYSVVRKHRGKVDVESELGRGTTFHVWLPALPDEQPKAAEAKPKEAAPLSGRVLFMDDEEPIRKMALWLLQHVGLSVELACDGREAVDKYASALACGKPYDVVVMDLTVPGGMDGYQALLQLRALDPHVKAIVSSGYSSDPVMADYRAHGFAGMVAKPYEIDDFIRVLSDVLQGEKRPSG